MTATIPVDLSGQWWLSEAEKDKVEGVLHLSPETWPILELSGRFDPGSPYGTRIPVILGYTLGAKPVTLIGCRWHGGGESSGWHDGTHHRLEFEKYSADVALVGAHVIPAQGQGCRRLMMRYTRLDEWIYGRGSALRLFEVYDALRKGESNRCTVDFQPEAGCTCRVAGASIKLACALNASSLGETGIALKPDVFVDVALDAPMEFLAAWEEYGLELQHLFSLLTGVPIRRQSLFAMTNSPQGSDGSEVEVIFPDSPASSGWSRVKWYDMLTEYRDLSSGLGQCIESWLTRDAKTRRAARSFLVARDGTHYLEQRFLELARALEVYYEVEHPSERLMNQDSFDTLVEELMTIVTQRTEHTVQADIRLGLPGLNLPSLATKLRQLFATQETVLPQLASKADSLAKDVRKWRVALTHLTGQSDAVGADFDKLHDLCDLMELTLEMCLLARLGIPPEAVSAAVKRRLDHRPGLRMLLGLEPESSEA